MLASYPIEATEENWLHESLVEIIRIIHEKLNANLGIPSWPDLIPAALDQDNRSSLLRLHGVRDRVVNYKNCIEGLSIAERDIIFLALTNQNNIVGLLGNTAPIYDLEKNYPAIYEAAHKLFVFGYEKLTDLGVRDRQYKLVFGSLNVNSCPFCGFERIMSPMEARQDQDHYLAKSIYPFAAANMRNLVPMCRCCNRDYKHDIDILKDLNGNRRKAFDPYNAPEISISLIKSIPFEGCKNKLPAWWIEFSPELEETETWDQVFSIRTRYSREVLNTGFDRWIKSFMNWCKTKSYPNNFTDEQVLDVLRNHYHKTEIENPVGIDFLKPKVFEMLVYQFELGNDRVIRFIRNAVVGIQAPA